MYLVPLIVSGLLSGTAAAANDSPVLPPLPPALDQYVYAEPHSGSWYLRATGGLVTSRTEDAPSGDIKFKDGFLASLGVGQRIGATNTGLGFSVEFDAVYTNQDSNDNSVLKGADAIGALIDGILDYRIYDRLSLYGGGGIGVAWMNVDTKSGFQDDDGPFFAWTLKAGVAWHFTPVTSLHLGYRFLDIGSDQIDGGGTDFDLDTHQHAIELGLMFGI